MINIATKEEREDSLDGLSHYDLRALDRLIFFSDAVFAIAITLLVLNITVPILAPGAEEMELPSALLATVPKLFSYALSFLVIGAYWLAHHRTFHYVARYDRGLAWLNLLFLLFVGLIPFPTGVVGTYGDQLAAAVLYAVMLAMTGLLMTVLWVYISHNHRLLPKTVSTQFIRASTWRSLSSPVVFLASIAIAFVSVPAAEAMWFLVFVINVALERRTRPV